jgi:CelD/BcsL family acetyltransferase involved in cellulose biosynthesis
VSPGLSALITPDQARQARSSQRRPQLTCRIAQDFSDIPDSSTWDNLLSRSNFNDVFASSGFAKAWWRAYAGNRQPYIGVVENEAKEVTLIAPLCLEPGSNHLRVIGGQGSDYDQIVFAKGDAASLDCLFRHLKRRKDWRLFSATCIPDSELMHFFWGGSGGVQRALSRPLALTMPSAQTWRECHPRINREKLETLGGLLQRTSLRKHVNWFNRQGVLSHKCATQPAELKALLPDLFRMHMAEWDAKGEPSSLRKPENQQFFHCLVEELGPFGVVRMDALCLDGCPVAAHFGFVWGGRFCHYKPAFDPQYSSHGPGSLLLAHMLKVCIEEKLVEFDFLFGMETYKFNYASDVRRTGTLRVSRSWPCWLRSRASKLLHRKTG